MMENIYYRKSPKNSLLDILKTSIIESYRVLNINLTKISLISVDNIAIELYTDITYLLANFHPAAFDDFKIQNSMIKSKNIRLFLKQNGNCINLLGDTFKIKIFLGQNKSVAAENFLLAEKKFPTYFYDNLIGVRDKDIYRIEIYKLVSGLSVEDLFKKDLSTVGIMNKSHGPHLQSQLSLDELKANQKKQILKDNDIQVIFDSFLNYLGKSIITTDQDGYLFYPNDFNIGNFVFDDTKMYDFPNNLTNIDYDHMSIHPYRQMVHNAIWDFVSRIFNKEQLPDDVIDNFVLKYRNTHKLADEVCRLKKQFLESINLEYVSERDRFEYPITLSMLNNDQALYDEIHAKEKTDD